MRQRFGALLCLLLGAVLITTGLGAGDATAGNPTPTCQPNTEAGIGSAACPTGTIFVNETTVGVTGATATPPSGGWVVVVTSANCTDPNAGTVNITLTMPNNSSDETSSDPGLFIYTDQSHNTKCSYTLTPQPVAGFTSTLVPPSPVTIPFDRELNRASVELTETATAPTSSSASSCQPASCAPATSAAPSDSASATDVSSSAAGSVAPTATTAPLATTGPRTEVTFSLWLGVGLLALGMVLLLSGARPGRQGRRAR